MLATPHAGKDADKLDHADMAGENVKHAAALGNSLAGSRVAKTWNFRMSQQLHSPMFIPEKWKHVCGKLEHKCSQEPCLYEAKTGIHPSILQRAGG